MFEIYDMHSFAHRRAKMLGLVSPNFLCLNYFTPYKFYTWLFLWEQPETSNIFDSDSTVCTLTPRCASYTRRSFLKIRIQFLGEIETEFETIFACLSRAYMVSNHEKMEVKNLVTHSL